MKKDYNIGDEIRAWSVFIPDDAIDYLKPILKNKWINTGKQESLLRKKLRDRFNLPHCVACNSGTSALRASLAALDVGVGDEVVTTAYTFIATNTTILEQGATPVFADVRYATLNIDPQSIEEKITKKTKAIMVVHYAGNPCEMDEIRAIAKAHNLPIVEDSAHSMGSKYKGDYIGSKGDVCTFSLQAVKIITSGDGGFISVTSEELYEKIRKRVFFGVNRDEKNMNPIDPLPEDIDVLGFKYNMNDITASLGIAGIDNFDTAFNRRLQIGVRYRQELYDCKKTKLVYYDRLNTPSYQIFPVHVHDRVKFASFMRERNIIVNVNNRRNDRYSIFGGQVDLPMLEKVDNDTILIPIHTNLTDKHVDRIIEAIHDYDKI